MEKLDKVIAGLECCQSIDSAEKACAKCPYEEYEMYCMDVVREDALRILKLWDVLHKDLWDRTHEIVRLKKELKVAREKLSWLEEKPRLSESGEPVPEFPREGM